MAEKTLQQKQEISVEKLEKLYLMYKHWNLVAADLGITQKELNQVIDKNGLGKKYPFNWGY